MITLLTEWLYIAAQMPHGTHAQQNVFRAAGRAGKIESALKLPLRGLHRLRGERPVPGEDEPRPLYPSASVVSPSDPSEHALEAFAQVVANLGWRERSDRIVFAHTHQPLADVRSSADSRTRYWNTRLVDLRARPQLAPGLRPLPALRLARDAVVVIDDEPEPRLPALADLNPCTTARASKLAPVREDPGRGGTSCTFLSSAPGDS